MKADGGEEKKMKAEIIKIQGLPEDEKKIARAGEIRSEERRVGKECRCGGSVEN